MHDDKEILTTDAGIPVGDNQNSLTAGARGPLLMQDFHLIEKMAHFNRERIPERVVHAKGSGAYGTFTVTNDITQYTKAKLFSEVGKQTEIIARFSTVAGERGAADAERDVRGFALKFYTEEGNWDMVGNNTPVFFVRNMNLLHRFLLCVSSCFVCFSLESVFENASSLAATTIAVRYGLLEQSVNVADIRHFAQTQKASPDLQSFLNYLDSDTQKEVYDALQVKMSLNIAALDKTLDTKPAQQLLSTISAGIARRDNAGIQAVRGAIILAGASKDGLGIVSFLEAYPSDKLVINVPAALEIADQAENLFAGSEIKPGQDNLSASPVWQTEVQYQIFASRGKQFSGCLFGDSVSAELGNSLGEGNFNFALNGLSAISLSQQLQLLAPSGVKCQKMVIAVGGNDAWYKLSDDTFTSYLRSSIATARQIGTKEIFLIPGFYSTDAASHDPTISATNFEVDKINALINQVASQENIPVIAKDLQILNQNNALKQEYSSDDGAHLNGEGIKIYRQALSKIF